MLVGDNTPLVGVDAGKPGRDMTTSASGDRFDWKRRAFGPGRRKILASIVEALFSSEDETGIVPASRDLVARVVEEFDILIGAGSGDLRRGYGVFVVLIEWLPILMIGALSRASRLSVARRVAYLDRLEHAQFGLLAALLVAFKVPLTILAFELDPDLKSTGYDREHLSSRRMPGRAREALRVSEAERAPAPASAAGARVLEKSS